eukprot:scaffold426_cov319-Pavlova_lutheri.AAC.52
MADLNAGFPAEEGSRVATSRTSRQAHVDVRGRWNGKVLRRRKLEMRTWRIDGWRAPARPARRRGPWLTDRQTQTAKQWMHDETEWIPCIGGEASEGPECWKCHSKRGHCLCTALCVPSPSLAVLESSLPSRSAKLLGRKGRSFHW